jgi:hypothetical protein
MVRTYRMMFRKVGDPARMRERTSTLHGPLRRASVAAMLLAMGFAGPAAWAQAADDPAPPKAEAAPVAPSESLRAVFIDVGGKVQWRPGEQDAWRDAKVNDVIEPGAEVRTGLRSHAALRVGRNATALVDAGTVFQIPSVVKEGDALRTTVTVKSGRADFKVDKVGFSNDFKVVTPSMTLAVRGTGFAVATGALKQVEVLGARRNAIAAIELKYALSSTTVAMSGGASSSSALQQPTHAAVVAAAPPTTASALPTSSPTEAVREAAGGPAPSNPNAPSAQQRQTSSVAKAATSVAQANGDSGSDGSSLLAAINRALVARGTELTDEAGANVAAAHDQVEHAIGALLTDLGEEELLQANATALAALRDLAERRRDAALAALDRLEDAKEGLAAGSEGGAAGQSVARTVEVHETAFDAAVGTLAGPQGTLAAFDAAAAGAADARGALAAAVEGHDAGEDLPVAQWQESIQSLHDSLQSMGDGLDDGRGLLVALAGEVLSVQAQEAIVAYREALDALDRAVGTGEGAESIASASRDTVRTLQQVVAALAQSRALPELQVQAQRALGFLSGATDALVRTQATLAAVRAARATAADDPRAGLLDQVDSTYARILEVRTRLIADFAALDAQVEDRASALGEELGAAQAAYESLVDAGTSRMDQAVARAEATVATLEQKVAQAQASVDAAGEAAGDLLAQASGRLALIDGTETGAAVVVRDEATLLAAQVGQQSSAVDAALATLVGERTINLGGGSFSGRQGITQSVDDLAGTVTGFTLTFNFLGGTANGTWASDAALGIDGLQWGGFNYVMPGHVLQNGGTLNGWQWSFYGGPASQAPGTYSDSREGLAINASDGLVIRFVNAWNANSVATYSDIRLTLRTAGGFSLADAAAREQSIVAARGALESMRTAIGALGIRESQAIALRDGDPWQSAIADVERQSKAALERLLLTAQLAAVSDASAASDQALVADIAATGELLLELADSLESRFGAEFGFSASQLRAAIEGGGVQPAGPGEGSGLGVDSDDPEVRAQAASAAAAALRAQAEELLRANFVPLTGGVDAWRAQVNQALASNAAAVSAIVQAVRGQVDAGLGAFGSRGLAATDRFAEHAAGAAAVAAERADVAQGALAQVQPLRALQVEFESASARAARMQALAGPGADGGAGSAISAVRSQVESLAAGGAAPVGGRSSAESVVAALDALDAAFLGALGSGRPSSGTLADDFSVAALDARLSSLEGPQGLLARAEAALDALLEAGAESVVSTVEQAASGARDASDSAAVARSAAERVAELAAELEAMFGSGRFDDASIAQRAVEATGSAAAAAASASSAESAQAAVLSQLQAMQAGGAVDPAWVAGLRGQVESLLVDARAVAAGADGQAFAADLGDYRAANELGAATFAAFTEGARSAIFDAAQPVGASLAELNVMSTASTQLVAALDGAELAADRADHAADAATGLRAVAEAREADALAGALATFAAVDAMDAETAGARRDDSVRAAALSRAAADLASDRSVEAGAQRNIAIAHQSAALAPQAAIAAFGDGAAAFTASAVGRLGVVQSADEAAQSLRADAQFYDAVAATLAGRADTEAAAGSASSSAAARALAVQAAQQLAGQAIVAQQLAETASSNAGRMFGRSMAGFVARAQAAADRAIVQAGLAQDAAGRAEGHAAQAVDATGGGGPIATGGGGGVLQ